jgi:class 3 adenylate cyclase
VASGLALLFEGDDYIGRAVNLAARLCDVAHRYEVLIPADCTDALPEGVTATPLGPVELSGFPQPVEVAGLNGEAPRSVRGDTGELWTRTPFVA